MGPRCPYFAMLALLAIALACDSPQGRSTKDHPGQPMQLTAADGPFSRKQLVEIARYYYPAMEYAESRASSGAEVARIEQSTPQWQARQAAFTQAMANRERWRDLVRVLGQALPDYHVADRTTPYLPEPAYQIEISPKNPSGQGQLRGMVSVLAPLYFICESVGDRAMRHPMSDEYRDVVDLLEREILERYPYHRLEHDTGLTIVPELHTRGLQYRQTTLIDLLLSTNW